MMPIDSSIYARFAPQVKSVQDYENEYMRGQANQLALLGAKGDYQDKLRAREQRNALEAAVKGFGSDQTANYSALLQTGNLTAAQGYQKGILEQRKTQSNITKSDAEAKAKTLDSAIKGFEFHTQRLATVNTPEEALAWAQQGLQSGLFSPEQFQSGVTKLQQAASSPLTFEAWKRQAMQGGMSVVEQLKAKLERDKLEEDQRQFGITSTETARYNKTAEGLTVQGQQITLRGQSLSDARARESNALKRDENDINRQATRTQIINDPVQGPLLVDKGSGAARQATFADGTKVPGESVAKAQANAKDIEMLLDKAASEIGKATGSYFGAGLDQIARVFGAATDGSIAVGNLKAIEGALLSKMPRMEGPQSNYDVQTYRQAVGEIGNPTIPNAQKAAAVETVKSIQQKYAGKIDNKRSSSGKVVNFSDLK